jgi:hypothetical protein
MAEARESRVPAQPKPTWLEREVVCDLFFAPLVRGAIWLFMHLLLWIKLAFIKVFLS